MSLDAEREKIAEELWAGADLPEPLDREGGRLDWVRKYKKLPNVWVRGYWNGRHHELFKIKWEPKTANIVSAGLM